ncbi:MAG: hypothetical protein Q3971_05150 [Moraxella sp.]|nr:hypothetical protein [Moraxella sp.]
MLILDLPPSVEQILIAHAQDLRSTNMCPTNNPMKFSMGSLAVEKVMTTH